MKIFFIFALIMCCNAGSQSGGTVGKPYYHELCGKCLILYKLFIANTRTGLLEFERMIYDFVEDVAPKFKELHHNLTEVIQQDNYGNGPGKQ